MTITIVPMTQAYARMIPEWRYEGIYSFYNHNEENADAYMDGTHFAALNTSDEFIGYFCFGFEARIPTVEVNVYEDDCLDIGLGLRPDLCGKQHGQSFLSAGMKYAQQTFCAQTLRLSVAVFNERAIKVYKKAGFSVVREVTNAYFKNQFLIMRCIICDCPYN